MTSNGHAYQCKQRNDKTVMHVYGLALSVRRSMETHIQAQADEKQTYTHMRTSF